jgi:predicted chitinase
MKFDTTDSNEENKNIGVGLGFTPFFWYNGIQVPERDIKSLEIYYEDYIPRAKVTFKDTFGLVKSPETRALNDTKFEIFLNSGSDILKSIHLKFKLEIQQDNKKGSVTITGIIDLKDFYKIGYKSYNGTSFEVLRKLSSELELGFNSNISNTNDTMRWRRNGTLTKDFIIDIVKHSYISDESFMIGYIDYYWCFNYVDIEKEWKRDISNDVAIVSTGVQHLSDGDESSKIVPLELTNDPSNNSSPFYFTNYRLNNNSTYQTTQKGTYTESKVYDRNKKQFLKFNIDSQTSDGDDKIILKGSPGDRSDLETNYRTNYSGKMDTDNVHENYLYAIDQNRRNLDELVKISIDMDLPQPNFNLYKYQKVKLSFINQKQTVTDDKLIDERLSGEWIIIDIRYTWSNGSLSQKITAVRKELGKTKEEIEEQDVAPKKEVSNSEINDNPVTPNSNEINENIDDSAFVFTDLEDDTSTIDDEFIESEFQGEEELAIEMQNRQAEQESSIPGPPTSESTFRVDDNNIDTESYVGQSWKAFSLTTAISMIEKTTHKPSTIFKKSLEKLLFFIKNDPQITDIREAAYLLGTAYEESGYSLQRWEADYACGLTGKSYGKDGPCQKALNYYKKSTGKKNYYDLGIDKTGRPYFGRGLIQLTGKSNYEKYGKRIGVDLVNNGDLALQEQNSYKVAVNYMIERTFKFVKSGDLTKARKSVNGGKIGINGVNGAYYDWLKILQDLNKQIV